MLKIAVIPGDGIGKEVMKEALKILELLKEKNLLDFEYDIKNWNSEYYLEYGRMMPDDGIKQLENYDAILFGAIGDSRVPAEISIWELIMPIRKNFNQYVNLRPVKLLKGLSSPLAVQKDIDFVILRENNEGEYSNVGGRMFHNQTRELAVQNTVMTRKGIEQLVDYARDYAKGHSYSKITNATKSNAIIHTMKFWDEVVEEELNSQSDFTYEKIYIDALAAYFVQRPESFEVVIASNLFGDILSDLGSALVGGLGVAPSGNINPDNEFPSMFEPVHGSAPDIAGENVANPIAQIWSVALMVDHFGRKDLHDVILSSIEDLLQEPYKLTADLGGNSLTEEVGNLFMEKIKQRIQ